MTTTSSADLLGLQQHFGSPMNRIQKLLLSSEYVTFDDTILVESPFAEVTSNGVGLRQVQLGLSATRLLIAVDVFWPDENPLNTFYGTRNIDPEINTLELVSLIPVELCTIRILRRKELDQQILNVELCGGRQMWFEFGGFEFRKFYWGWWQDRVDALRQSHNLPKCTDFLSHSTLRSASSQVQLKSINQSAFIDVHREPDWTTPRSTSTYESNVETVLLVSSSNSSTSLLVPKAGELVIDHQKRVSSKTSNESWIYQQLEDITKIFALGRKKKNVI